LDKVYTTTLRYDPKQKIDSYTASTVRCNLYTNNNLRGESSIEIKGIDVVRLNELLKFQYEDLQILLEDIYTKGWYG
jgi:hypothetical protein